MQRLSVGLKNKNLIQNLSGNYSSVAYAVIGASAVILAYNIYQTSRENYSPLKKVEREAPVVLKASRKNPSYPGSYGCVQIPAANNNFLPSRVTSSSSVECLSFDGANCIWGSTTQDSCQKNIASASGKTTKNLSANVTPTSAGWPADVFKALG